MTGKHIFALALATIVAAPAVAATDEAPEYLVRVVARDGDAAPTTPTLTVRAGSPATFMVSNDSYMIRLVATPAADNHVSLSSEYNVWTPQGLRYNDSTVQLLANGEPASIAFSRTDPASGEVRQMRFEVSVQPLQD